MTPSLSLSAFTPTPEQQLIEQCFNRPDHPPIKVVARAGSGKSSTARYLGQSTDRKGLYLAFGKKNADEARRTFPKNVQVKTTHALAFAAMQVRETWGHKLKDDKNKWPMWKIVKEFGIAEHAGISGTHIASVALQAVRRFMYSADAALTTDHVWDSIKGYGYFAERLSSQWTQRHPFASLAAKMKWQEQQLPKKAHMEKERYQQVLLNNARALWEAMISRSHPFPMEHDAYLKLWQMSHPIIRDVDFIIIDESQDQNNCVLDLIIRQPCQLVLIGDEDQNIFSFRLSRNIMADLDAIELYLSMSFRFGQTIADVANGILSFLHPDLVPIRGNPAISSVIGPVTDRYALVARTNAGIFNEAVNLAQSKIPFHVVGSLREPVEKARAIYHLWNNEHKLIQHPEIKAYDSFNDLTEEAKFDPELARFARLVEENQKAVPDLCNLLEGSGGVSAKQAEVILTTAHKSKGLQYPQVRLAEDYSRLKIQEDGSLKGPEEEIRVLYVAATRAERRLELNEVAQAAMA